MKFSVNARYPHPVLSLGGEDFERGEFGMRLQCDEDPEKNALIAKYQVTLEEENIEKLIKEGTASMGCFVDCVDTYHSELIGLKEQSGKLTFAAGTLYKRVTFEPAVFLNKDLPHWKFETMDPEFGSSVSVKKGGIIAIGLAQAIWVGPAKGVPTESIFTLEVSSEIEDGIIKVGDLDGMQIPIQANEKTMRVIKALRGQKRPRPELMSGVYLPVLMEVLDAIRRDGGEQYEGRLWREPLDARCDKVNIKLTEGDSSLVDAQKLLGLPVAKLERLQD